MPSSSMFWVTHVLIASRCSQYATFICSAPSFKTLFIIRITFKSLTLWLKLITWVNVRSLCFLMCFKQISSIDLLVSVSRALYWLRSVSGFHSLSRLRLLGLLNCWTLVFIIFNFKSLIFFPIMHCFIDSHWKKVVLAWPMYKKIRGQSQQYRVSSSEVV